jgi:hypothetical protein
MTHLLKHGNTAMGGMFYEQLDAIADQALGTGRNQSRKDEEEAQLVNSAAILEKP